MSLETWKTDLKLYKLKPILQLFFKQELFKGSMPDFLMGMMTTEIILLFHLACREGIAENQCFQSSPRETLEHYELLQGYQQSVAQCCNV